MGAPVLITAVAVLALLALALTVLLLRGRADSQRRVLAARAESEALRTRLEALEARLESTSQSVADTRTASSETSANQASPDTYLITDAGVGRPALGVADRAVLTATLGEPLVRAVALGHGLRRALSAESRNRIRFEVRRQTRRARKQRRRDTRASSRRTLARQRSADQAA